MSDFSGCGMMMQLEAETDATTGLSPDYSRSLCSFKWTVHNFKIYSATATAFVESPVFHSDENEDISWKLSVQPDAAASSLDLVSVAIECITGLDNVRHQADVHLALIASDAGPAEPVVLGNCNTALVFTAEAKRHCLQIPVYCEEDILPDDRLTVRCELDVRTAREASVRHGKTTEPSSKQLSKDLHSLLQNETDSDVVLRTAEGELKAHRLILAARSIALAEMLAYLPGDPTERLDIKDTSLETLKLLVAFIYTGHLRADPRAELTVDSALELLEAADRFRLPDLGAACSGFLRSRLTVSNAVAVLSHADRFAGAELKRAAIDFISPRFEQVVKSRPWKEKLKQQPHLAAELLFALSAPKKDPK